MALRPVYLELRGHEVVDDGVDGRVEVAHAVGDDAGVHQDLADALVAGAVPLHVRVHEELQSEEDGRLINFMFPFPTFSYLLECTESLYFFPTV